MAKLGSARTALGKFDDGLHDLREALKITRKELGRSHRTVAQILCHIGCLYFEANELFSAQSTFEDALDIYRAVFPTDFAQILAPIFASISGVSAAAARCF